MKSILFITTNNLATNPRILKELDLAYNNGYRTAVMMFNLKGWSSSLNDYIIEKYSQTKFIFIETSRTSFLWIFAGLVQRFFRFIGTKHISNLFIFSVASDKRSLLLLLNNRKIRNVNPDLIIAHNLGALFPAQLFSKKYSVPFAFDIEDFHPGEKIDSDVINEQKRRKILMQQIIPSTKYISYASPLIGEESINLVNKGKINRKALINNCFKADEFQYLQPDVSHINLVWFSQHISFNRGLEEIIEVIHDVNIQLKAKFKLHLIGNLNSSFNAQYLNKLDFIEIHQPLNQKELNLSLSHYDIGLAIEQGTSDFNRQICLTNKIWAYFQSGLFILATDTRAQIDFLEKFNNHGTISEQNKEAYYKNLAFISTNITAIRDNKMVRYKNALNYSWEEESKKLIKCWESLA